jgi:hypothetical protein
MRVTSELWMTLCEEAANEQDPQRLLELVKEINDLLEEKRMRLNGKKVDGTSPNGGNGSVG